jgi:hypothetical protein
MPLTASGAQQSKNLLFSYEMYERWPFSKCFESQLFLNTVLKVTDVILIAGMLVCW